MNSPASTTEDGGRSSLCCFGEKGRSAKKTGSSQTHASKPTQPRLFNGKQTGGEGRLQLRSSCFQSPYKIFRLFQIYS